MVDNPKATPKVTIVIPTYNRANKFLRSAIECALEQSWPHLEIIVADNCSTDNTAPLSNLMLIPGYVTYGNSGTLEPTTILTFV